MTSSEEDSEYGMVNTDEMVIRPYMYEPLPKERRVSEDKSSSNDDDEEDLNIERIGNTDWCDCGHCVSMPKGVECLCCREVALTLQKANEANCGCITQVDGFTPVCLNPDVVVTAIYQYIEDEQFIDDHPTSELFRYISYRQFVRWIWHYLGKNERKVLPACAVNKIRCVFPSEEYTGFKYPKLDI